MTKLSGAEFIKNFKSGKIKSSKLFLYGEEVYLTGQIIKAFKEKFDVNITDINDENFLKNLEIGVSHGLFSKKEPFIIVRNLNLINSKLRKKADKERFVKFLKEKEKYLLISETKLDWKVLKTELFKKIQENADLIIEVTKFSKNKVLQIIKKKFKSAGKEIDNETIIFIIDTVGTDLQILKVETDKLICFPGKLTKETVSELLFASKTTDIFSLIKFILKNEKKRYLENLEILFTEGIEPLSFLALLQTQVRQITDIKRGKKIRLPQNVIKEYINLTQNIPIKKLYITLKKLHETEFNIKAGIKKPEEALKEIVFR